MPPACLWASREEMAERAGLCFRHLDRQARLGFHSAPVSWQQPYKRNEPANAAIAAYMAVPVKPERRRIGGAVIYR
jgi:hypothetical protein